MAKREYEILGHSITAGRTIARNLKSCYRYDVYMVADESIVLHIQDYPEQFPYLVMVEKRKWDVIWELIQNSESVS